MTKKVETYDEKGALMDATSAAEKVLKGGAA